MTHPTATGDLSAREVLDAARDRYHRDPLAHARVELAVRVVDTQAGAETIDDADYRTLIRAGALVALELDARHLGAPEHARDVAAGLIAGVVHAAGAPAAADLARDVLDHLERAGLTVAPR